MNTDKKPKYVKRIKVRNLIRMRKARAKPKQITEMSRVQKSSELVYWSRAMACFAIMWTVGCSPYVIENEKMRNTWGSLFIFLSIFAIPYF